MTNIVKTLNLFLKDIKERNQVQQWEEKISLLTINAKSKAEDFIKLFESESYNSLLHGSQISFEFIYDNKLTIRNADYLEYFQQGLINNNDEISLVISLNKKNLFNLDSNSIIFFNIDAFNSNFHLKNIDFINFLKSYNPTQTMSIFLPIEETLTNDLLKIQPIDQYNFQTSSNLKNMWKSRITRIKDDRDDLSRVEEFFPIPDLFSFRGNIPDEIKEVLNKNLFYLSLLHLANKTKEDIFIIRGQKTVEISWDQNFEPKYAHTLFHIFNFAFGKEQTEDKLEITRNILTIYLHEEPLTQLDEELDKIDKTIKRHFSLYVQDKIKKFFDDTKDAIDLARKYALEAKEAADKIVGNINTAIITLITAVFSAIVLMSRGNYQFFIFALILHIIFLILSFFFNHHFAMKKKENIESIYDLTITNFINISKDEKQEIKEKYVTPALNTINSNLKKYFYLCLALILVMLVLIFVGIGFSEQLNKNTNNKNEQENIKVDSMINVNPKEGIDSSIAVPKATKETDETINVNKQVEEKSPEEPTNIKINPQNNE